jgi:hypothetical protein
VSRWVKGVESPKGVPGGDLGLRGENDDQGSIDAAPNTRTGDEICPAAGDGGGEEAEDAFGGLGAVVEWLRSSDSAGAVAQEPTVDEDDDTGEESDLVDALTKRLGFT